MGNIMCVATTSVGKDIYGGDASYIYRYIISISNYFLF